MTDLIKLAERRPARNICANCGWHWFDHKNGRCKGLPRNKDGSYSRYSRARASTDSTT